MQDEITKHSKKAFTEMKNSDHSLVKKIKEISIEIFIIVFAVSFSIWLHSWSEHRHQQQEVNEFLTDLKEDLTSDIESLTEGKRSYLNTSKNFSYITNLTESNYDSLRGGKDSVSFIANLNNKFNSFPNVWNKSNSGNYEGFKSSGKIGFIENKAMKRLILEYFEQAIPGTFIQEEYIRQTGTKTYEAINDIEGNGKKILFNKKVQSCLKSMIVMCNACISNYDESSKAARAIISEIDKGVP